MRKDFLWRIFLNGLKRDISYKREKVIEVITNILKDIHLKNYDIKNYVDESEVDDLNMNSLDILKKHLGK